MFMPANRSYLIYREIAQLRASLRWANVKFTDCRAGNHSGFSGCHDIANEV